MTSLFHYKTFSSYQRTKRKGFLEASSYLTVPEFMKMPPYIEILNKPYIFTLLESANPLDWKNNQLAFALLVRTIKRQIEEDSNLEYKATVLRFELLDSDESFVLEFKHILENPYLHGKGDRGIWEKHFTRYLDSMVAICDYGCNYTSPEVIVANNIPEERVFLELKI